MLKLTTDKHEASRSLSATAELLVLFWTDEILYNLEDLFLSPLRTQLQLHFQRSLCNTLI